MQIGHELRPLTSARGIAAWYVVLYHIRDSAAGLPAPLVAFFSKGYLAVDFFFVLSGFVIWLNYGQMFHDQRLRAVPHFLWRRISRIYPLHLLMLLAAIAYATVCVKTGRPVPDQMIWADLPHQFLLTQNWGFIDHLGWNSPAWSISCELAAYLVFPLLVLGIDWLKAPTILLFAVLGLLMAGLYAVFAINGHHELGTDIPHLGLPRCLFEFAMGTIVAALWLRWREASRTPAIIAALLAVMALAGYAAGVPETLALPFASVALLMLLSLTSAGPNPLKGRAIHWLGEISYATYLGHALLFLLFKVLFVTDLNNVPLPLLGVYLLMVFAASALLYHGFELPAQRWINRRGPKRPVS